MNRIETFRIAIMAVCLIALITVMGYIAVDLIYKLIV